jgi:hypothetical protein
MKAGQGIEGYWQETKSEQHGTRTKYQGNYDSLGIASIMQELSFN